MRFLIKTISGRQGYKSFKNLNEYVDFMTNKGHLIQDLKEADLPYTDKPVKLPKVSKSNGWSEVSDFGGVGEEAEKGESLIASTSKSVMKDEASFEMSKSSGKADKPEMGLGAEKGDVDMSDFKSFEYEEPKLTSSETKSEKPSSEEPKKESSEKKEEPKKEKSSKKEDDSKKHDKDIEECLKAAGVQLNEFFKFDAPEEEFKPLKRDVNPERPYIKWDDKAFQNACERIGLNNFLKDCRRFFHQTGGSNTKANFLSLINDNKNIDEIIKIIKDNCDENTFRKLQNYIRDRLFLRYLNESIKDYLPRAGFIRDDDEDKDSSKMGIWGGQGTDDQLRKAKIIAKVKFANGDRFGRVTSDDLEHFDDYKRQYDEIYGMDESLNEGERWDKFKDSVHNLGVKAKQGLGLAMDDEVLESYGVGYLADVFLAATKHITPDDAGFQDTANRIIKTDSKMKNLHNKVMKFLQDKTYTEKFTPSMMEGITRRFLTQLGIDEDIINQAYEDYKEEIGNNQKFDESDDGFDDEIAECLKSAGC